MPSLFTIFFTGMLISFLGSLPLGSLNVSAMQVAITEGNKKAIQFSLGVALVEIVYVRLSLTGIGWIIAHEQLFYILEWITVFLFILLAISSFWTAAKKDSRAKNILLSNCSGVPKSILKNIFQRNKLYFSKHCGADGAFRPFQYAACFYNS